MNLYHVAEYESGWYVEMPHPKKPLAACVFVQVAGPYEKQEYAERKCKALNKRVSYQMEDICAPHGILGCEMCAREKGSRE